MILFVAAGLAAHHFLAFEAGFPLGLILGLLLAPFVPVTRCLTPADEDVKTEP